jgi:hypothetical protein
VSTSFLPIFLASTIIQGKINDTGKIKNKTREVNLNADQKRFWVETLKSVKNKTRVMSYPLNPPRFPKAFELNDEIIPRPRGEDILFKT